MPRGVQNGRCSYGPGAAAGRRLRVGSDVIETPDEGLTSDLLDVSPDLARVIIASDYQVAKSTALSIVLLYEDSPFDGVAFPEDLADPGPQTAEVTYISEGMSSTVWFEAGSFSRAEVVPLPPAIWPGLVVLGAFRLFRRRRTRVQPGQR